MRREIGYDALDRVTEVRRYVPATASEPAYVETYAYNALGGFAIYDGVALDDRRPRLDGGGTASAGIPAALSGQPVTLDVGGRVTSLKGQTFQYFKLNHRLQAIQSPTENQSFIYDSLERLIQIESGAPDGSLPVQEQLFVYNGLEDSTAAIVWSVVQAPTPTTSPAPDPPNPQTGDRFIYDGLDHPLAIPALVALPALRDNSTYFELDTLGNVRHRHGATGGTGPRDQGSFSYTAFGRSIPPSEPGGMSAPSKGQPGWQGRRVIGTNLYDFRARVWSAELGAFLQPDEYGFLTPTGTLWSWPGQNPFRWRDPSGRGPLGRAVGTVIGGIFGIDIGAVAGAAIGGGATIETGPGILVGVAGGALVGSVAGAVVFGAIGGNAGDELEDAITGLAVTTSGAASDAINDLLDGLLLAGHRKARPSTHDKHTKKRAGAPEKADPTRALPRQRPDKWKGPWPPPKKECK